MGVETEKVHSIPDWAFFTAQVNGLTYGLDLRELAVKYAYRKLHGIQPVAVNPVTLSEWNPRTRLRMVEQLDQLVDQGHLPKQLLAGWHKV